MLDRVCGDVLHSVGTGRVASYIPALARIEPGRFGAAILTTSGESAVFGDAAEPFSIQSISKIFTLTMALEKLGADLWARVGREPSGNAFNSIVQLEHEAGVPRNPLINAGAVIVDDVLLEDSAPDRVVQDIRALLQTLADDRSVYIDAEVAASEAQTGFRNRSLAHFMKSFGNLTHSVDDVLHVYFHQCALAMSCEQLARAALPFANQGVDPLNGSVLCSARRMRRINSVMLMCGHYDASGDFAFRVGLPGKSGVGGGIVAVVPGRAAIAVWSPCLTESGNSLAGTLALERIVQETGGGVF